MRASLLTFGCRVNQAESQAIERELVAAGAEIVDPAHADLIIVNSCSVTATADQGTRQSIRRVARENPSARIVVTGCYATRAPAEVAALPGVVHIVPNARKDNTAEEALRVIRSRAEALPHMPPCVSSCPAPGLDQRFSPTHTPSCDVGQGVSPADTPSCDVGQGVSPADVAQGPVFYGNRTAFTLRVQTGCEESCSYCVIPSTRGAERSTPLAAVITELHRV